MRVFPSARVSAGCIVSILLAGGFVGTAGSGAMAVGAPDPAGSSVAAETQPADLAPAPSVAGAGATGSVAIPVQSSDSGTVTAKPTDLVAGVALADPSATTAGLSGSGATGDTVDYPVTVAARAKFARFAVTGTDPAAALTVRLLRSTGGSLSRVASAPLAGATKNLDVFGLPAGDYVLRVTVADSAVRVGWSVTRFIDTAKPDAPTLTVDDSSITVTPNASTSVTVRWDGLTGGKDYLGLVGFGTSLWHTLVSIVVPAVPIAPAEPSIPTEQTPVSVSAVAPGVGSIIGGEDITVTGAGFGQSSTVLLGGAAATVLSATPNVLTARTPAHTAGATDVTVTTLDESATLENGFTYLAQPGITTVQPPVDRDDGGFALTIFGTGFTAGSVVTLGGVTATSVSLGTDGSLTATFPVGTLHSGPVTVETEGGKAEDENNDDDDDDDDNEDQDDEPSTDPGSYIVQLKGDPAALYNGDVEGYSATEVDSGDQLDGRDPNVIKYSDYLEQRQDVLAARYGVTIGFHYSVVLDGFSGSLTASQVTALRADPLVADVSVDGMQVEHSTSGSASASAKDSAARASVDSASPGQPSGAGTVIGIIDTGYSPSNPLFAGPTLGILPGAEPWVAAENNVNGNLKRTIEFRKLDGGTFSGGCEAQVRFAPITCNSKVIAARMFLSDDQARRLAKDEIVSPVDVDGHGSGVASIAAGVSGVVDPGDEPTDMTGVAPDAKLAIYKVGWRVTDPQTQDESIELTDAAVAAAIEAATEDGVDIINLSVGSPRKRAVMLLTEGVVARATRAAAAAGIFVTTAAGNSGPGPSTMNETVVQPWVTSVANHDGGQRPVIDSTSSRGPVLGLSHDLLSPDIAAVGEKLGAAGPERPNGIWSFGTVSGTSASSPVIAGVAAVYLTVHPHASPSEIKSALMTTASPLYTTEGAISDDVFAGGAGAIDGGRVLNPGVAYLNGPTDWRSFISDLYGTCANDGHFIKPVDQSDLNVPSVQIGELVGTQTITRRLTATEDGDWTVAVPIVDGIKVTVTPQVLHFAAGEIKEFRATFTNRTGVVGRMATGHLTWTQEGTGKTATIPIAVRPADGVIPAQSQSKGDGANGVGAIGLSATELTQVKTRATRFVLAKQLHDASAFAPRFSGSGYTGAKVVYPVEIKRDAEFARFSIAADHPRDGDILTLTLWNRERQGPQFSRPATVVARSIRAGTDKSIDVRDIPFGDYVLIVTVTSASVETGLSWTVTSAVATSASTLPAPIVPSGVTALIGRVVPLDYSWSNLPVGATYVSVISYIDAVRGRRDWDTTLVVTVPPRVDTISVARGSTLGGEAAVISGLGFTGSPTVTVGGANAPVTSVSPTRLGITLPPHAAGIGGITVTSGGLSASLDAAYTYEDVVGIRGLARSEGRAKGNDLVAIYGTGLERATSATVGGVAARIVKLPGYFGIVTPAHEPGLVDVSVTIDGIVYQLPAAFTYVADGAPVISSVSVSTATADGPLVTILGSGFTDSTTIGIGSNGAPAVWLSGASVQYVGPTTMQVLLPEEFNASPYVLWAQNEHGTSHLDVGAQPAGASK